MVRQLREEEKCQLIACLSHPGYQYPHNKIYDRKLARQVSGIYLILGGHTHTFMVEPERVFQADGQETLLHQVGWAGINLGRIGYVFTRRNQ